MITVENFFQPEVATIRSVNLLSQTANVILLNVQVNDSYPDICYTAESCQEIVFIGEDKLSIQRPDGWKNAIVNAYKTKGEVWITMFPYTLLALEERLWPQT